MSYWQKLGRRQLGRERERPPASLRPIWDRSLRNNDIRTISKWWYCQCLVDVNTYTPAHTQHTFTLIQTQIYSHRRISAHSVKAWSWIYTSSIQRLHAYEGFRIWGLICFSELAHTRTGVTVTKEKCGDLKNCDWSAQAACVFSYKVKKSSPFQWHQSYCSLWSCKAIYREWKNVNQIIRLFVITQQKFPISKEPDKASLPRLVCITNSKK